MTCQNPFHSSCFSQSANIRGLGKTRIFIKRICNDSRAMKIKEDQFLRYDHIICLKINNCKRTRGYDLMLAKEQSRLDIRMHSFSQKAINEWNILSTEWLYMLVVLICVMV